MVAGAAQFVLADRCVTKAQSEVAITVVLDRVLNAAIECGLDEMNATRGRGDDLPVPGDQGAILEHVGRTGEHRFAISLVAIDGDVGRGAVVEVAATRESQQPRWRRAREGGDLRER